MTSATDASEVVDSPTPEVQVGRNPVGRVWRAAVHLTPLEPYHLWEMKSNLFPAPALLQCNGRSAFEVNHLRAAQS
jgi:hypothetical protein